MQSNPIMDDSRLTQAKALVQQLEAGDEDKSNHILDDIMEIRESRIFQEVGKLTRQLHDALSNFRLDARMIDLTHDDIPDARERLNYVIKMTDQAANRTLHAAEESKDICGELKNRTGDLLQHWQRFMRREMQVDDFRLLCRQLEQFLPEVGERASKIGNNLSEVVIAQEFQDLTGQIIRQVITLVEEVEQNLVDLLKISGQTQTDGANGAGDDRDKLEGPQIPGKNKDAVSDQDEVDELLSSFGF